MHVQFRGDVIQAFLENSVVRVRLSNLLLKALLNQQAGALEDLELFDQDLHRNLTWMLENDITGVRLLVFNLVLSAFAGWAVASQQSVLVGGRGLIGALWRGSTWPCLVSASQQSFLGWGGGLSVRSGGVRLGRVWSAKVIDETMTATVNVLGEVIEVDLLPDGAGVPVTNENKEQFANLKVRRPVLGNLGARFSAGGPITRYYFSLGGACDLIRVYHCQARATMLHGVRDQMEALRSAFAELVPASLLKDFSVADLYVGFFFFSLFFLVLTV